MTSVASPTIEDIVKGEYRLVLTPTGFSGAFPYGGTQLGLIHSIEFEYGHTTYDETAEEWGGTVVRSIFTGVHAGMRAVLRGMDVDAIAAIFPTYSLGASGKPKLLPTVNGTNRGGRVLGGSVLLFVPENSPEVNQSILLYNAIGRPDERAKFSPSRNTESGIAAAWMCAPDSAGRLFDQDLIGDLSL